MPPTSATNKYLWPQGAVVGFLVSFTYNICVVVGKFVRGGGSPPRLPLSVDGCPENLGNVSLASFLTSTQVTAGFPDNTSLIENMFDGEDEQFVFTTNSPMVLSTTEHPQT